MKIEQLTVQGSNAWNEDALIVNESCRIYGVLDGATSLTEPDGGATGGYLASQAAKLAFESPGPASDRLTLREAVLEANARIRARMAEAGIDVNDKRSLWSAACAVVRIGERQIEYAQVGDCMIVAVYEDGSVRTVTHDQVEFFDERTRSLWEQYRQEGRSPKEVRENVYRVIASNRLKTNTPEGYAILNGDPALERYVEHGAFNRIRLRSVIVFTDGLFLPRRSGEPAPPMREMVRRIEEMGLAGYADWLIAGEHEEAERRGKDARLKVSDDKTAIRILFD